MRVLVWQWGRRGAGPRFAAHLAAALDELPGVSGLLSLSTGAEILGGPDAPRCALPVPTYATAAGLAGRMVQAPWLVAAMTRRFKALRLDLAIDAMPGPLDLLCVAALRGAGVPAAIIVHDADAHPGDGFPLLMGLQRRLVRRADAVVALSWHVAGRLRAQRLIGGDARLIVASHPPFDFGAMPPPFAHGAGIRLLTFGRLLPYKGLDLLAEAMRLLGPIPGLQLRVVGSGPDSEALRALRVLPGVRVENRWVAEPEIGGMLAWADALVLPYREASQSGVAAAAVASGRPVICTRVGGLIEQLAGETLARWCDPTAASLAAAIRDLLSAPALPPTAPRDPAPAWRALARQLLNELGEPPQTAALSQPAGS
ncbi:MAG TPA: glycosyltransferase family 4 protein [Acetobacteraceae bacterium]|nr:glycosyltransferase family 4 protein [Acetobacteraceae bacterium]